MDECVVYAIDDRRSGIEAGIVKGRVGRVGRLECITGNSTVRRIVDPYRTGVRVRVGIIIAVVVSGNGEVVSESYGRVVDCTGIVEGLVVPAKRKKEVAGRGLACVGNGVARELTTAGEDNGWLCRVP
ncbi:MAG TPA: hypothetical protein PLJ97_01240 [Candidatus Saccharibacteria bacterium]|nr:hypothetical protein [Candidatus Saccharibacteria bacterium]